MHRFSDLLFQRLDPWIVPPVGITAERARLEVGAACRTRIEMIAETHAPPARIARHLFTDIRFCFPLARQADVFGQVARVIDAAAQHHRDRPHRAVNALGEPIRCPVLTRRGTPCRREPLANGHCPSHQHLVEVHELREAVPA